MIERSRGFFYFQTSSRQCGNRHIPTTKPPGEGSGGGHSVAGLRDWWPCGPLWPDRTPFGLTPLQGVSRRSTGLLGGNGDIGPGGTASRYVERPFGFEHRPW